MTTKEEREFYDRAKEAAAEAFSSACRDPNITVQEYESLRRKYMAAMARSHAAHGLNG